MKNTLLFFCFLLSYSGLCGQTNSQDSNTITPITRINVKDLEALQIISLSDLTKEGQKEKYKNYIPNIIPEYFLLGIIGFNKFDDTELDKGVRIFNSRNVHWINDLVGFIKKELNIEVKTERKNNGQISIYSEELITHLVDFYKEEKASEKGLFHSTETIYSFLSGIYFLYGTHGDNELFCFSNYDSSVDSDMLFSLFRKAECNKIEYRRHIGIPGSIVLLVDPSVLLEKYFIQIDEYFAR